MTICNWELRPDRAVTITDTLASDYSYRPAAFLTKSRNIPHLNVILAAKGLMQPLDAIWHYCMGGALLRDVDDLVAIAPPMLAHACAPVKRLVPTEQAELYLFGWSRDRGRMVGYAFSGKSEFQCEPLPDGRGMRPTLQGPTPSDWAGIVLRQQAEDLERPIATCRNLGGDLVVQELTAVSGRRNPVLTVSTLELPHRGKHWTALEAERFEFLPPTLDRWQRCERWLAAALEYHPCGQSIADVRLDYQRGRYALLEGRGAALLIEPVIRAGNLHALAYLVGGDLVELSEVLRPKLEAYAQSIGAATVVIGGRKGWARAWRRFGYLLVGRTDPKDWITAKKITPVPV